jgi:class 3 adenylate cyclase
VLLARTYELLHERDEAAVELAAARDCFAGIGATLEEQRAAALLEGPVVAGRAVRTFVFTDIVDSTRFVELLGDEAWENLLAWHDRTLRSCIREHAGEEVKHEGDGFFVAFVDAPAALACAVEIQRTLAEHRREHGFAPQLRIGIHTAEATERAGDYTGRGVHIAARVAGAASAGEIVASRAVLDAAGTTADGATRALELKGVADPVEVATVAWS